MTIHETIFFADKPLKEHVVLKRGNDTTFIEAENDPEFLAYLHHFEKFKDEFGNNQFVYVDNIDAYKQKIQERLNEGTVPQRPYQITIGEFVIQSPLLYYLVTPQFGGAHVGEAYFFVNSDKNQDFFRFDYRDQVKIIWSDTKEIAFNGFPREVYASGDTALFLCSGGKRRFFESGLAMEPIGITVEDSVYFIAKSLDSEVIFEGGPKPLLKKRGFIVIFPVRGLILPSDLTIEQVLFTKDISKFLTDNIKQSKTMANIPWKGQTSFAVVEVTAQHFFEAMVKAEKIAKRAIDWIQFRTDISLPCIDEHDQKTALSYNMSKAFSKCYLIPYGLAIDSITKGAIFNLLNVQSGHHLVFHHSPQDFFNPLVPIVNKLEQINNRYSPTVQPLYEALSWLMQSFEVESPIDNLLQLWIAFEFICSGERIPQVVSDANLISSIFAIQSLALPMKEETALIHTINQVNNRPLMEKWNKLLLRLEITLTSSEKRLVTKLRVERNKLEHGRESCNLTIDELDKFRSILERVFIKKANALVESHYAIQDLSFIFGQ
jgi:hypothetical protein